MRWIVLCGLMCVTLLSSSANAQTNVGSGLTTAAAGAMSAADEMSTARRRVRVCSCRYVTRSTRSVRPRSVASGPGRPGTVRAIRR